MCIRRLLTRLPTVIFAAGVFAFHVPASHADGTAERSGSLVKAMQESGFHGSRIGNAGEAERIAVAVLRRNALVSNGSRSFRNRVLAAGKCG